MNHKVFVPVLVTLLATAVVLQAAEKKEKGLPPGLQKKDKLPPGWEKKQGSGDQPAAAPATNAASAATPAKPGDAAKPADPAKPADAVKPAPTAPTRSAQETKASVEKRIQSVNALDERSGARKGLMAAISKETGVPARTLENQREQNPKVGAAGILIANELAAQTKKPARGFYRQHEEGKSWAKIAADNNVSLEAIEAKLTRIEAAAKIGK